MKKVLLSILFLLLAASASATVNITDNRIQYSCNGSTTVFTYPFQIYEDDDLVVTKSVDATGDESTLVLNTDYTVTDAGAVAGGTVVLSAGSVCGSGNKVTITRAVDLLQRLDFVDGEAFSAEDIERGFDKLTLIAQDQQEDIGRSVLLKKSSDLSGLEYPEPSANASLCWNSTGTEIVNCPTLTTVNTVIGSNYCFPDPGEADQGLSGNTLKGCVEQFGSNNGTIVLRHNSGSPNTTYTLSTPLVIPDNITTQFENGALISGNSTLTINGVLDAGPYKIFDPNTLTVSGSIICDDILVEWYGASYLLADSSVAIKAAVETAKLKKTALSSVPTVFISFSGSKYTITEGIPVVSGVGYKGRAGRHGTTILSNHSGSAMYTATYSGGVFTDNLDATLGDVTGGGKDAPNVVIQNLFIDGETQITGNAPSGEPWTALVRLVGAWGANLFNVRVTSGGTGNYGIWGRYCWRINIQDAYANAAGFTGGYGIFVGSTGNNYKVDNAVVLNGWEQGIRATNPKQGTIISPNVEGCNVGVLVGGDNGMVLGGEFEGNGQDVQLGVVGGTQAIGWVVQGTYHLGSAGGTYPSANAIYLANCAEGTVFANEEDGAYSGTFFKSETAANGNVGNFIRIRTADAMSPGLSSIGLDDGKNVVQVVGSDGSHALYGTENQGPVETLLNQKGAAFNSFWVAIQNNAGTLEARVVDGNNLEPEYATAFNTRSASFVALTTVSNGTPFGASGVGILSGSEQVVILDVGTQIVDEQAVLMGPIVSSNGTVILTAELRLRSRSIGGVDQQRIEVILRNAQTNANWPVNTTNLPSGTYVKFPIQGYIQ